MRKVLYLLYALILALLLPAAVFLSPGLPVDTGAYVAQKYSGWNGVLQAWVCCAWEPGGNFIGWLNSCAADFEKRHEGVYIEFTPVTKQALQSMHESGIRKPELIFFSPGMTDGAGLKGLESARVREELRTANALPVAMGGYIWVYNRALTDGAPTREDALTLALPADGNGRCFSAGTIALLSGAGISTESELPETGLDLGLPANAAADVLEPNDALKMFMNGELACLPVTQQELARLQKLRDAGRGPDWACAVTGEFAWADQILLAGVVSQTGETCADREALAEEFALGLLDTKAQAALANAGAFAVTGETVHPAHSPYAALDQLINSRRLAMPDVFSEYYLPDGEGIVRDYCKGLLTAQEALGVN